MQIFYEHFRAGIYLGTILTFLGGLVRGFSTMPFVAEAIDKNVQFWLGFVGQTLTGMGNPMAVAVPTKVKLILAFKADVLILESFFLIRNLEYPFEIS